MSHHLLRLLPCLILTFGAACLPPPALIPSYGGIPAADPTHQPASSPQPIQPSATVPAAEAPPSIWLADSLPPGLHQVAEGWGLPAASNPGTAALHLDLAAPGNPGSVWYYALVAPFPTVTDGVTGEQLRRAWQGDRSGPFGDAPLWMSAFTLSALSALWGQPAPGSVRTAGDDAGVLAAAWEERPSWGVVPFESLEPRWKVLTVDGQSPIHKDFDPAGYPLAAFFSLRCADPCPFADLPVLPESNRDPSRMTTVAMNGVTALVRATAYRMELHGVTYPGLDVRHWLREADITHISNEVAFAPNCPYPDPFQTSLIFCSDPKYIGLLEDLQVDVVELTGNHIHDWGSQAGRFTLDLYQERGWPYYGGGRDLDDARRPALLEHNGHRFAFIGCNPVGPPMAWATEFTPGAAPCDDLGWMVAEIDRLQAEGYIVIATFQHFEYYTPEARPEQRLDFRLVAEAGAVVVSGSQAHFPQVMEFHDGSFIHYGLGNLFFDQMDIPVPGTRRGFIDRHVFYDGRHLSTELLTTMLEDYARPRPMTPQERRELLEFIFSASGW
jgi:hypothetical protein